MEHKSKTVEARQETPPKVNVGVVSNVPHIEYRGLSVSGNNN